MKDDEILSEDQIIVYRELLMGKRVRLKRNEGDFISGVVTFFGYNSHFPGFGLQVTLDRLPIRHVKLENIEIIEHLKEHEPKKSPLTGADY